MSRRWLGSCDVDVSPAGAVSVFGLIPTGEQDLAPIVLSDDQDRVLNLPEGAVILQLKSDASFVEGQQEPSSEQTMPREAGVIHSIPVAARALWHFKRVGTSTVTLKGKVLLAG